MQATTHARRPPSPLSSGPAADPTAPSRTNPIPRSQRLLLGCGLVGPVLFTGIYLIDGAVRPGYDAMRASISALGTGDGGWVQSANFLVFGLLSGLFTLGLRRALQPGRGAALTPLLRGVGALGLILDGVFAAGPLHQLGDALTFTALPLACFVLARRLAREPCWRGWATFSVASGLLFWALLVAFSITNTHATGPDGLYEKLAATVMSVWLFALAARLSTRSGRISFQR